MLNSKYFIEMDFKYGAHNYHPIPVVISKARGCWLRDVEGKKYLDCLSAYSSQNLGHCHPKILKALKKQVKNVAVTSRAFHNDKMGPFLKKICELASLHVNDPHDSGMMALPMNTGAEAVETGLKITRAWGYIKKKIPPNQAVIIVCENNFHGRTITIVGFSTDIAQGRYFDNFGPFTPGFEIISHGDSKQLEQKIKEIGPERVAGFLFEPFQGEAGVKIPPEGYLKEVRDLCTKYNVLMIADEIQTGLCRTGKLFACDHENIKPDVLLLGKALGGGIYPVSIVISTRDIMGPEIIKPGTHGSTFGGNSLASAVAMKALDLLIDEHLSERAAELGTYFMNGLKKLQAKNHNLPIKEIRGKGLLIAIEFTCKARPIIEILMKNGLLAKDTHETTIRLAPPLIIKKKEIDWALNIIEKVLFESMNNI